MSDDILSPSNVRARAVGNAVYLEHVGGCGDIASWAELNAEAAEFVADQINGVLSRLRDAKDAEIGRLRAEINKVILAAGSTLITDGDTTCTLGWFLTKLLEGKA